MPVGAYQYVWMSNMYLLSSLAVTVILTWEAPRNYCAVLSALSGYCKGIGIVRVLALTTRFDAEIMIAFHGLMCDRYCSCSRALLD
jgi:hypothetical protein